MKKNILLFTLLVSFLIIITSCKEPAYDDSNENESEIKSESVESILSKASELAYKIDPCNQKVILFYYRPDRSYYRWGLWMWNEMGLGGDETYLDTDGKFQKDKDTGIAYMVLDSTLLIKGIYILDLINNNEKLNFLIRDNGWSKDPGCDQEMDLTSGDKHFCVVSGNEAVYNVPEKNVFSSLEISSLPKNLNYFINGKLDLTGLVVKMNLIDGTQMTLSPSDYTVEPPEGTILSEQGACPIKITAAGRTAYFSIYVGKTAFTGLKITNLPDKIWYEDNDLFDTTGLEVTAVFNDGKDNQNRVLEEWEYQLDIKNGSALEAGSGQKVTVSYCGKTASFIINVGSTWETYEFTDDGTHILSDICMNNTNLRNVTIPDTITEIPAYAFYGCTALESITLPASVRYVHKRAFKDCISLQNLIIEPRTEWLDFEEESFSNCVSLQNVDFENAAGVSLKTRSFEKCNSLVKIDFKTSVRGESQYDSEKSGEAPFYNCENLEEVNFNNLNDSDYESFFFESCPNLKTIQNLNYLIRINYCPSVTQIEIPQNQNFTTNRWLQGCSGLTEIEIPNSYKTLYEASFKDCTTLTSISIPNSVTEISIAAFENCTSLASITIPNSVTEIRNNAFENCTSIEQIQLPPKLETLDSALFRGCKNLKSIEIPSLVENIGCEAFKDCTSLTSITIPNSVTDIGYNAFNNCTSLEKVIYGGTKSEFSTIEGRGNIPVGVQIICNDGSFIYGE